MSTGKATPPEPTRASGESGGHRYDPGQRLTAARIQHANPHWLLLWGTHSRRYFAFPMFTVPPGTIVTASEPDRLVTRMRQAEATTAVQPRMPAGPPPASQPVARR